MVDWLEDVIGVREPADGDHVPLHEFERHDPHPDEDPDAHGVTLRHPDVPGVVVVNAETADDLESHLHSSSIHMAAVPRRPDAVFLDTALAEAVAAVSGDSLASLLQEAYVDPIEDWATADMPLADVLGDHAEPVVGHTAAAVRRVHGDVSEDDAVAVVSALLSEPAAPLVYMSEDGPDGAQAAVVTTFGLDGDEHDLAFSVRDVGSIAPRKDKVWGPTDAWRGVHCTVTTTAGNITWRLYWGNKNWKQGQDVRSARLAKPKSKTMSDGSNRGPAHKWYVDAYANQKSDGRVRGLASGTS